MALRERRGRLARLGACAVLMASVLQGTATAGGTRDSRELKGVTIASADRSSWVEVRLPRPVTVSTEAFDNPMFEVLSGGPLAGAVLRRDVKGGVEALAIRADLACAPGCSGEALTYTKVWDPASEAGEPKAKLPAGRYQLYVIADGKPTTVRIELPGLSGSNRVRATTRADAKLVDATPTLSDPAGPFVYSAQADHAFKDRGISLMAFEVDTDPFVAISMGACLEDAESSLGPADPAACESRRTPGTGAFVDNTLQGGRKIALSLGLMGPGAYDHQISYRGISVVKKFVARELQLTYATDHDTNDWLYSFAFSI